VVPRHSADLLATERCAAVLQDTKETPTQGARLTLAHSHLAGPTLCVRETVESPSMLSSSKHEETEPFVAALTATPETLLSAATLTPALRAPAVQMLIVSQMETELCASVGRDMRVIHLSTVFSTRAPNLPVE